jgi:PAAR motif
MDGPKPHVGGAITPAAAVPTVLIGGSPAAVANAIPGGIVRASPAPNGIAMGSMTVLIGRFPGGTTRPHEHARCTYCAGAWLPDGGHRRVTAAAERLRIR